MVIVGQDGKTQFSWIEYQVLMLVLTGVICATLFFAEIALNRFQVLPLLFPGMFSVRERRFYFFSFDISNGSTGKSVRAEAKKAVRITIFLVLSYLWQHSVLSTTQIVGTEFPKEECDAGADCFASELLFSTLWNRDHRAVNCNNPMNFEKRMVVSCIRFITPTATNWLMHLAIAHSVTQLNFKAFEMLVWVGGNSKWCKRTIGLLIFISLTSFIVLFFTGVMSEFVSSWLSFVMSLTIPLFLHSVYVNCKNLEILWDEDAVKVHKQIENHLACAFADIETAVNLEAVRTEGSPAHIENPNSAEPDSARGLAGLKARGAPKQVLSSIRSALSQAVRTRKSSPDDEDAAKCLKFQDQSDSARDMSGVEFRGRQEL